jgi:hypothetical protein
MRVIKLTCPSCEAGLKVDADRVPKKARCPRCGAVLTLPTAAPAPAERNEPAQQRPARNAPHLPPRLQPRPPVDDEDADLEVGNNRKATAHGKDSDELVAWRRVRLGLVFLLVQSGVQLAWSIPLIVGLGLGSSLWFGLFVVLAVPVALLEAAADFLIAFVPERYASRALMKVVVGIHGLRVVYAFALLFLFWIPLLSKPADEGVFDRLAFLGLLLAPLGLLILLQFVLHKRILKQLACTMEDSEAEGHLDTIVKWQYLPGVALLGLPVIGRIPGGFAFLFTVIVLLGLASKVLYVRVLISLRASIAAYIRRRRPRREKRNQANPANRGDAADVRKQN